MPVPHPQDWSQAYARIQRLADKDVLAALRRAIRDIEVMLRRIDPNLAKVGDLVRMQQLQAVKRNLLNEQSKIFNRMGDIIGERRALAAAAATNLGSAVDDLLFEFAGQTEIANQLRASLNSGLRQTIDVAITRMTVSAVPLAQRIYNSNVWANGVLQKRINSALLRGLSAREFAAEARDWFRPDTPGGVRYASMRLARTEINNAFHATSVLQAQEKPWISSIKWHLSGSHPKPDQCDAIAKGGPKGDGVYPKMEVPRKPHPQCFCFVTPVSPDEDDFLDNLVAGHYDQYLRQKMGQAKARPTVEPVKPTITSGRVKPPLKKSLPKTQQSEVFREAELHAERVNKITGREGLTVGQELSSQARLTPRSMRRLQEVRIMEGSELDAFVKRYGRDAVGGYVREEQRIISTPGVFRPWYEDAFKKDLASGWSSKCAHSASESFIAHEYGHHLRQMLNRASQQELKELWSEVAKLAGTKPPFFFDVTSLDKWVAKNQDALSKLVSRYGATDHDELLADIWAEYSTNANARDHIKVIGKVIQRIAEANA